MDKQKEQGLFWLSSNPGEKVDGAITLDDEHGTMLTAYGQLGLFNLKSEEQQIIHGVLTGGHIKLVNCFPTNQRTTIGKFASTGETTWHCQFAFRGDKYCGDVPNRIRSVEADIELLGGWTLGFEGIQLAEDGLSLTWSASQPDEAARWDLGVVDVRQDIRSSGKVSGHAVESATVRANTSVRISFDEPQSWETVMGTVVDLQALVSIAKGEAVHVERTSIVEEGAPEARLRASYRPVLRRSARQIPHSELFTMQELGGVEGIARWLNVLHDRESLITALLVDRYRQPAFITDRISHLLIASEAYQRHFMADRGKRIDSLGKEVLDPMLCRAGRPFEEWVGKPENWKKKVHEIRNNYGVGHLQGYAGKSPASPDFHLDQRATLPAGRFPAYFPNAESQRTHDAKLPSVCAQTGKYACRETDCATATVPTVLRETSPEAFAAVASAGLVQRIGQAQALAGLA